MSTAHAAIVKPPRGRVQHAVGNISQAGHGALHQTIGERRLETHSHGKRNHVFLELAVKFLDCVFVRLDESQVGDMMGECADFLTVQLGHVGKEVDCMGIRIGKGNLECIVGQLV